MLRELLLQAKIALRPLVPEGGASREERVLELLSLQVQK